MGYLDAIKRWKLAQRGFSKAKKRRIHKESELLATLEKSLMIRCAIYGVFLVISSLLVLKASPTSTYAAEPMKGMLYGIVFGLTAVAMFHFGRHVNCQKNSRASLVLATLLGHLLIVRLIMTLVDSGIIRNVFLYVSIPFSLAPMLISILLGRRLGSFAAVYVSLLGSFLVPKDEILVYQIISMVAGMVAVLFTDNVRRRVQLLRAGSYVGLVVMGLAVVLGELGLIAVFGDQGMLHLMDLGLGCLLAVGLAMLTAMVISGLLPLFETFFHLTTPISWLELSDLNHKLLKRMQLEAPGTFHHSLVVAALSEAAAESIGANAPMCRVCSYFHDVGKLNKPSYFIENQYDQQENPHDSLTPTMSALIIIAHVKDGIDLAVKHKLNPRIIDVIREHHGDSLVYYFYRKAQDQKKAELEKVDRKQENPEDLPKVDEKNFRYPNPRPSSRESGIICLADTVESASRTLKKPTPAKIRGLVDELIKAKIQDGQLDACPLTLGELSQIKESFSKTLQSMLHTRIDFPKNDEKNDRDTSLK